MTEIPDPISELNSRVTDQILAAEQLDDTEAPDAVRTAGWAAVSLTEEELARTATDPVEVGVAQRGAVSAAEKSGDEKRAETLRTMFVLWDGSQER
jgi:hypothetical protein